MAFRLDTVTGRAALKARHAPYWAKIQQGCYLGYRKVTADSVGAWLARTTAGYGKYQVHSIGALDGIAGASRYDEALKLARVWFEHREHGGSHAEITIEQAWNRYFETLKPAGAEDAKGRYKRWIEPDQRLAQTKMLKLTVGQIKDWRTRLEKTFCIPQDKSKEPTKPRSASAINRDIAVFRAVLNRAKTDGYASSDSAWSKQLKPIAGATGRRDVYVDATQRSRLIEHADPDIALFIRALSLLPLRPGAVASLVVANFDPRLSVLTVGKDKAGKDRKLSLPIATAHFFAAQCKNKLPKAALFTRADGKAWSKDTWKKPLRLAALAAGLPTTATAYTLRHSVITDLVSLHNIDLLTVAAMSGTSVAMIESYYGHLLQERAMAGLAKLVV
ncbi:MAG: site-specific integrase [Rhodoferax sp.]|uniref:tyrosine-type recombinase/integrase n=1 Tax=Rhodoferax sp. TaxID=50421 RepID=UPI001B43972B|nr:tyrosine-type recombinase/integrase [Rhodoferax sp.]MBP9905997.1 site-specific integrase [Rhodoferax sp.]